MSGVGYLFLGAVGGYVYYSAQTSTGNLLWPSTLVGIIVAIAGLLGTILYLFYYAGRWGYFTDLILANITGLSIILILLIIWGVIFVIFIGLAIKTIWDSEVNKK